MRTEFERKRTVISVLFLILFSIVTQTMYAAYKIVVYNGIAPEVKTEFTGNSDEKTCTVVIPNYSGNLSDYKYWIGNNGVWEEGISCEFTLASSNAGKCGGSVSGSDYMTSCPFGKFSVKIYSNSGDKNRYPHGMTPISSDCMTQSNGSAIPANTIIFFDNTNTNFSEVWLSVPAESSNGNSNSIEQGYYKRRNDKWYQMIHVSGNIWSAEITQASEYGRMSFWNRDGSSSDDVWDNILAFQAPYTSGKNLYTPTSVSCYSSGRKSTVYYNGSWSIVKSLKISGSVSEYEIGSSVTNIVLTASSIGYTGNYKWEYQDMVGGEWKTLAETAASTYTLSGAFLPASTTSYRVTQEGVTSNEWKISVLRNCGDDGNSQGKNIFRIDFGTLPSLKGNDSRGEEIGIAPEYTYQPYGYKINDGYYAVVTTPYYCGCGDGGKMGEQVDVCEGNNMWFRSDLRDHTINNTSGTGPFGAMLMINYSTHKSDSIAYERELTPEETKLFVNGSQLTFAAWFASAAKQSSEGNISMKVRIQYREDVGSLLTTVSEVETKVKYEDNWKRSFASMDITGSGGLYKMQIVNYAAGGTGNDVLIDDISLDLCVPTFPVEFYDAEKGSYTKTKIDSLNQELPVRIEKKDFGVGENPCVLLLEVDSTKTDGSVGKYKYVSEMDLSVDLIHYEDAFLGSQLITTIPDTVYLQVLVSASDNCTNPTKFQQLVDQVENGQIYPLYDMEHLFSSNYVEYVIDCKADPTIKFEPDLSETSACESGTFPNIKLDFDYFSPDVYYTLLEDGNAVIGATDIAIPAGDIANKTTTINLDDLKTSGSLNTSVGEHIFSVIIYEQYLGNKVCERTTASTLSLSIKAEPTFEAITTPEEVCQGYSKQIQVTTQNTDSYLWQVSKSITPVTWEDAEGENDKSTYTIPTTAEDGWQYRVLLSNSYCDPVSSNIVTLSVSQCQKVILNQSVDNNQPCKNDEVVFTLNLNNGGTTDADVEVSLVGIPQGLEFVKAEPSAEFDINTLLWDAGVIITGNQSNLNLTFKVIGEGGETHIDSVYISTLGAQTWASYEDQSDNEMKDADAITIKEQSAIPSLDDYQEWPEVGLLYLEGLVLSDRTNLQWFDENQQISSVNSIDKSVPHKYSFYVKNSESGKCQSEMSDVLNVEVMEFSEKPSVLDYNECPVEGTQSVETLITSDKTFLKWFDENKILLGETPSFDMLQKDSLIYYVTNKEIGECESDTAQINIVVRGRAQKIDIATSDFEACLNESVTLTASSTLVTDNLVFTWYADAELTEELGTGAEYNATGQATQKTYYVTVQNAEYCENNPNDGAESIVSAIITVSSVSLTPESEEITLGSSTEKVLVVEPVDAIYNAVWTANGNAFDPNDFPMKPYSDVVYSVSVTDECETSIKVDAETIVLWPTVITPNPKDGFNDDFIVDLDEHLAIIVFDRYGNKVYEGDNGWPNNAASIKMPGVYYYKVTLPDGTIKKGPIEIFKTKN